MGSYRTYETFLKFYRLKQSQGCEPTLRGRVVAVWATWLALSSPQKTTKRFVLLPPTLTRVFFAFVSLSLSLSLYMFFVYLLQQLSKNQGELGEFENWRTFFEIHTVTNPSPRHS